MQDAMRREIAKLKKWACSNHNIDEYDDWWSGVVPAVEAFISDTPIDSWSQVDVDDLLYAVAHDNVEHIPELLLAHPKKLLRLAALSLQSFDPDAKWPLAIQLPITKDHRDEAEALLLQFVHDSDEYVSRRALLALSEIGSTATPSLVERAWQTGHEYQRIAALWALRRAAPELLPPYLVAASEDGREYLARNVEKLRAVLPVTAVDDFAAR